MAKDLIPEVCKLLGVEVGEKFKLSRFGNHVFSINYNGTVVKPSNFADYIDLDLADLLFGRYEIVRSPYKPKKDGLYYTLVPDSRGSLTTCCKYWNNSPTEFAALKFGWIWRTEEEAERAIPEVTEKLKEYSAN